MTRFENYLTLFMLAILVPLVVLMGCALAAAGIIFVLKLAGIA